MPHARIARAVGKQIVPGEQPPGPRRDLEPELWEMRRAARARRVEVEKHGGLAVAGGIVPPVAPVEVEVEAAARAVARRLPGLVTLGGPAEEAGEAPLDPAQAGQERPAEPLLRGRLADAGEAAPALERSVGLPQDHGARAPEGEGQLLQDGRAGPFGQEAVHPRASRLPELPPERLHRVTRPA